MQAEKRNIGLSAALLFSSVALYALRAAHQLSLDLPAMAAQYQELKGHLAR